MIAWVNKAKKFVTAVAGLAGVLISTGFLSGQTEHWVTVAIGAVTAVLVYLVPNSPTGSKTVQG